MKEGGGGRMKEGEEGDKGRGRRRMKEGGGGRMKEGEEGG